MTLIVAHQVKLCVVGNSGVSSCREKMAILGRWRRAGEATKTFSVKLLPAAIGKPARTVRLVLSGADKGATVVMGPSVGVLTITG